MFESRFEHSVKVPRLYKTAGKIVMRVKQFGESVKQVYDTKHKHVNIKALYAIIVATLQNDSKLELLLKESQILVKEPRLDPWLAKVLITELLWGKNRLPGGSKPIETVLSYQQFFTAKLNDVQPRTAVTEKVDKPRYVRINTIKISINDAVNGFRDEGWILIKPHESQNDYASFLSKLSNLKEDEFTVDIHVPNLLIFPPKTEFYNHYAYKNGLIVLQDKASCLPAHILNPKPGSKVLDMCAAPGMKTTQLAGILNNSGTIFAVERDLKRLKTLNDMVDATGASECVKVIGLDVLNICPGTEMTNTNEIDMLCSDVEYILVDPSCSGSGMIDRYDVTDTYRTDENRLKKLAGFQIKILKHALRSFSSVKRVVYSTCSLNTEENEDVVREVITSNHNFKLIDAKTMCYPWMNFGSDHIYGDIGRFCLYSRPEIDLTNGFFIAIFERLEEGDSNCFLAKRFLNLHNDCQDQHLQKDKTRFIQYNSKNINKNEREQLDNDNDLTKIKIDKLADDVYQGDNVRNRKKKEKNKSDGHGDNPKNTIKNKETIKIKHNIHVAETIDSTNVCNIDLIKRKRKINKDDTYKGNIIKFKKPK